MLSNKTIQEPCNTASASPTSPVSTIRNRARGLREEAHRLEQLADKLESISWSVDSTTAFYELIH